MSDFHFTSGATNDGATLRREECKTRQNKELKLKLKLLHGPCLPTREAEVIPFCVTVIHGLV
jgi:hypothetical protein